MWYWIALITWFVVVMACGLVMSTAQFRFFHEYQQRTGVRMPLHGEGVMAWFDSRYAGLYRNSLRALFRRHADTELEDLRYKTLRRLGICVGLAFAPMPVIFVIVVFRMLTKP